MSGIEREPVFDPAAFGRSIRVLLAELNIQQREAARMMGVDKCVLNRICKHGNPPSVENYLRITAWMNGSTPRSPSARVSRLEDWCFDIEAAPNNCTIFDPAWGVTEALRFDDGTWGLATFNGRVMRAHPVAWREKPTPPDGDLTGSAAPS